MNATMQAMVGLNVAYAAKRGGGTIAGFHEMHLLDTGAIAIFDEENNLLQTTTTANDLLKVQKFYIAQGNISQASTPKVSIPIDRDAFTQWYNLYEAPVLMMQRVGKVATVGSWNFPGTFLNGTFATVVVTNASEGVTPNSRKTYTVPVTSADTVVTVGQKLRDAINANESSIVTATYVTGASDDYLQLVSKTVGTTFVVGVDDLAANALISKNGTNGTADNFTGYGTAAKVLKALEEDKLTRGGSTLNQANVPYFTYPEVTVTGLTFHGWTFQWKEEAVRSINVTQTATPTVALFLVVGGTGLANINTILNTILRVPSAESGSSASGKSSGEGVTVDDIPAGGEG
jgi:hypothetical protein